MDRTNKSRKRSMEKKKRRRNTNRRRKRRTNFHIGGSRGDVHPPPALDDDDYRPDIEIRAGVLTKIKQLMAELESTLEEKISRQINGNIDSLEAQIASHYSNIVSNIEKLNREIDTINLTLSSTTSQLIQLQTDMSNIAPQGTASVVPEIQASAVTTTTTTGGDDY